MFDFLEIPSRTKKPRSAGITHVIDCGIGIREVQDLLETSRGYIDIVKMGFGTSYVTHNFEEKVAIYKKFGIPVYLGGTLLEIALIQDRLQEFLHILRKYNISLIEVSNSIAGLSITEKHNLISTLSKEFIVISEVGSKYSSDMLSAEWIDSITSDTDAGASKIVIEASDGGTVGICDSSGRPQTHILDSILQHIDMDRLIFEAPKLEQQVFFIEHYGSNVNLGNIPVTSVTVLETVRLGLRYNTARKFHANFLT